MVFLQNGADVNRLNDVGDTALHRAAYTGRVVSASKPLHSPLHSTLAPGHSAGVFQGRRAQKVLSLRQFFCSDQS